MVAVSDVLHAWMDDSRHVGVFTRDGDGHIGFEYDVDAMMPISVSLPLTGGWARRAPEAFVDNLLPDEEAARQAMMHRLGAASTDAFDLLDRVDSTGGLVFSRREELPSASEGIEPVGENMLADQMALVERRPHSWWNEEGARARFSLAGAQGKFSLTRLRGQWYWPDAMLPSTHIVKPQPRSLADLRDVELAVMRLAGLVGLPVPQSGVLSIRGHDAYMVERFDRSVRDGRIVRLRQEDLLQAMGLPVRMKYDVGVDDVLDLLHRVDASDELSYMWLERYAFNISTANSDAHAKNYSLMTDPDGTRLSPVYDAVATRFWPEFVQEYAMPMDEDAPFAEWVTPAQWAALARRHHLDEDRVTSTARIMAARVLEYAESLSGSLAPHVFDRLMWCLRKANESIEPLSDNGVPLNQTLMTQDDRDSGMRSPSASR